MVPYPLTSNLGSGPPLMEFWHISRLLLQFQHVVSGVTIRCGQQSLTVQSCKLSSLKFVYHTEWHAFCCVTMISGLHQPSNNWLLLTFSLLFMSSVYLQEVAAELKSSSAQQNWMLCDQESVFAAVSSDWVPVNVIAVVHIFDKKSNFFALFLVHVTYERWKLTTTFF